MANQDSERQAAIGMRAGSPSWLPDDGSEEPATNPAGTGKLATSGRDDVERGDTVSGLGSKARRAPSSGKQSGDPTPGNRG